METGDIDYHSAAKSLWDSIVDRKYYVTGGVGSGETLEGFGPDNSMPNNEYCGSLALAVAAYSSSTDEPRLPRREVCRPVRRDALQHHLMSGSFDLEGQNCTYTNALDSSGGGLRRTVVHIP